MKNVAGKLQRNTIQFCLVGDWGEGGGGGAERVGVTMIELTRAPHLLEKLFL